MTIPPEGLVGEAVFSGVEAFALDQAGGGVDGSASEVGEGGFVAESAGVVAG
jgi:hypothetical protein